MTDFLFIIGNIIDRRWYANYSFVDKCGSQVSLLSNVTPRYLTVGFHGMGKLSKFSGSGVKQRRRLRMIAVLFGTLICIFQFFHHANNIYK
jgi:hypothetical protein